MPNQGWALLIGLWPAFAAAEDCGRCHPLREDAALREQFDAARKAKDWAKADRIYPGLIAADSDVDGVRAYLLYERGRCGEVLEMLKAERANVDSPSAREPHHQQMLDALVCEAARLESTNPAESIALLGEALDKERETFPRRTALYQSFASQETLYLPAMQFLRARQLDLDANGWGLRSQIESGRTANVRKLLELGADPNERHGGQHAALDAARTALNEHPSAALEIVKLLLEYGADPNLLVEYGPQPEPATPEEREFNALLSDAAKRIAVREPVRVDFTDYEALPEPGSPSNARFFVVNNTEKDWNLGFLRDADGIEYSGSNVSFEYVVWPGTRWRTYEWQAPRAPDPKLTPVVLEAWGISLVRVPVSFYNLLDAPPGLRLRLRIRASDGTDFVSEPFSLHDSRYVRNRWPRKGQDPDPTDDPRPRDSHFGEPVPPLPRASAIPADAKPAPRSNALHDHSR